MIVARKLEVQAVDEATWLRSRGWALSQALLILSYYTMGTNPTLVVEARRWMGALFADQDMTVWRAPSAGSPDDRANEQ